MSVPAPPDPFDARVQSIVRASLAISTTAAYITFVAFGVEIPQSFDLLTGAATGFFLGGAIGARR
jgi:hypothetical protein